MVLAGRTLGKRLFHLRVMDAGGLRLQFSRVVVRNLLRIIDILPMFYMVGGMVCLPSGKARRIGDIAANTIVIWSPPMKEPDLTKIMSDKYNSLRAYPVLATRLRHRITPEEAGIALNALLRRDALEPINRVTLFKEIAGHFKAAAAFPQEATDGVSDEQYVRNVVDILFHKRMEDTGI